MLHLASADIDWCPHKERRYRNNTRMIGPENVRQRQHGIASIATTLSSYAFLSSIALVFTEPETLGFLTILSALCTTAYNAGLEG